MRWRGTDVAGVVAIVGVFMLMVLTFWPESEQPTTATTSPSGESILGSPQPSPTASPDEAASGSAEPTASPETATIPPQRRGRFAVQVLNAGAPDGAAALATGALAEQSFQPREPTDAVAESAGTVVLFAENRRRAGLTVGGIVGADRADVVRADADDPNWAAFGDDLDVLVIIGPPIP